MTHWWQDILYKNDVCEGARPRRPSRRGQVEARGREAEEALGGGGRGEVLVEGEGVPGEGRERGVGRVGDPGGAEGEVGTDQGCQMAKFDPFLSLDCARVEGVGAQSKERKGSNFAA